MDENLETLWKIYNAVNGWIKFSDTKAAAVLATNGVILTIFLSNITKVIPTQLVYNKIIPIPNLTKFIPFVYGYDQLIFVLILSIISGTIVLGISIIYAIKCLIPNTNNEDANNNKANNKDNCNNKESLIFFGDIAKYESSEKYSKKAKEKLFKDLELKDHIFQEIWINSIIASNKYSNVKLAIEYLLLSVFFFVSPLLICVLISIVGVNFGN